MKNYTASNAYQKSSQGTGYAHVPAPGSPSYTEAWALIEAARRMGEAIKFSTPGDIKSRNAVRDALRLNWRLWTIFQTELLVTEDTSVPDELRVSMLTLCKFVDQHTAAIMSDPTPDAVVTLIEINRNIASGLLNVSENEVEKLKETTDLKSDAPYQPKGPAPMPPSPSPATAKEETPAKKFDESV